MSKKAAKTKNLPIPQTALERLRAALCVLDSSGSAGFEGLVQVLFERLLGRSVYLMNSGSQGGGDAYTGSFPDQLTIIWEDKRYLQGTALPVDELTAKLDQASRKFLEMDIWVLAATKEISTQHVSDLEDCAKRLGVGFLLLDWPKSETRINRLAALCAECPDLLTSYGISQTPADLDCIKTCSQSHVALKEVLDTLTQPTYSYTYCRDNSKRYLRQAFGNRDSAYIRLGCWGNISGSTSLIKRKAVAKELDEWWSTEELQFAIVHGDEGRGKSWAVYDWINSNLETLPMVLAIPAQKLGYGDIEQELAEALKRENSQGFPLEYYKKQINRWKLHRPRGFKILLIVDGLNQNYAFKHEEFLLQFAEESWQGFIKVIVTIRTGYLGECNGLSKILQSQEGALRSKRIKVSEFSDEERAEYLQMNRVEINDVGASLLRLIAIPRYAALAIQHAKDLQGIEACTVEHLMLMDWKDRAHRQSSQVSSEVFFSVIQSLAQRYYESIPDGRNGVALKDLKDAVNDNANMAQERTVPFIHELSNDSWLKKVEGSRLFSFDPKWTSSALALILIERLETQTANYEEEYAQYIEPLNQSDIVSTLIFSGIAICLGKNPKNVELAQFLALKFLDLQNRDNEVAEQFYKLALIDVDFFLLLLEKIKGGANAHLSLDSVKRSLVYACGKKPQNQDVVIKKVGLWLGVCVPPTADNNHPERKRLFEERKPQMNYQLLMTQGVCISFPDSDFNPHDIALLSRLRLIPGLYAGVTAWFISQYLLPDGSDAMSWILRWCCTENEERAIVTLITSLDGISVECRVSILDRFARLSARPSMAQYVQSIPNQFPGGMLEEMRIGQQSLDPQYKLLKDDSVHVATKIGGLNLLQFDLSLAQTSEEFKYSNVKPFLARFLPQELARLERDIYNAKSGLPIMERALTFRRIQDAFLIMGGLPVALTDLDAILTDPLLLQSLKWQQYTPLLLAKLSTLSFEHQLQFLENLPQGMTLSDDVCRVLDGAGFKSEFILDKIADSQNETLCLNLLFIGLKLPVLGLDENVVSRLSVWIQNGNGLLKSYSLRWLLSFGNAEQCQVAYNILWPAFNKDEEIREPDVFNLILHQTEDSLSMMNEWCHPQFFPVVIKSRGYRTEDLEYFGNILAAHIQALTKGLRTISGKSWSWFILDQFDQETFDRVLIGKPLIIDDLDALSTSKSEMISDFDDFPLRQLCIASWKIAPVKTQGIWERLFQKMQASGRVSNNSRLAPFLAATNFESALDSLFLAAKTDYDLLWLAVKGMEYGKIQSIIQIIDKALNTDLTVVKAKGLVLAGFLLESAESNDAWRMIDALDYSFGWLKQVRTSAKDWFKKGQWAKYWFSEYAHATSDETAYGMFVLFESTYDLRVAIWLDKEKEKWLRVLSKRKQIHYNLQDHRRVQIQKRIENDLKKTLGFAKINSDVYPWW